MSIIVDDDIEVNETQLILQRILDELRIMNMHFAEWDSMRIKERDLYEEQET